MTSFKPSAFCPCSVVQPLLRAHPETDMRGEPSALRNAQHDATSHGAHDRRFDLSLHSA
jgi:hypothetical protein